MIEQLEKISQNVWRHPTWLHWAFYAICVIRIHFIHHHTLPVFVLEGSKIANREAFSRVLANQLIRVNDMPCASSPGGRLKRSLCQ